MTEDLCCWHGLPWWLRWLDPCVGKIPWRREQQPSLVFLPGESHGQMSVTGYSPQGHTGSDKTEATQHTLCFGSSYLGLPWQFSSKKPTCQCRRCGFVPWVGKIPWRRAWQPTSVFLPGESHGQRSLAGTVHGGHEELGMTEHAHSRTGH